MNLNLKRKRLANKISIGDSHDLSIEWFMTHTDHPFYVIECVGNCFRICGAEEVEDADTKKETRETREEKQPQTAKPKPGGIRGGSRGRNKRNKTKK